MKDALTIQVDGVMYYRIHSPVSAVANITDVHSATFLLAQTTLRKVLGTQSLAQLLAGREEIAHSIQVNLALKIQTSMEMCSGEQRIRNNLSFFLQQCRGLGPAGNKAPRSHSLTPPPRWDGEEKT